MGLGALLRKEIRDQTAHVVWSGLVLAPIAMSPGVWTFAYAGLMAGLIREVTELKTPVTPAKVILAAKNSKLDLLFWTLGGAGTWRACSYVLGL